MDWNKKNGHKNPMHFFRRGKGFFNGSSLVSFGAIKTKWVPLHVFSSQAAIRTHCNLVDSSGNIQWYHFVG